MVVTMMMPATVPAAIPAVMMTVASTPSVAMAVAVANLHQEAIIRTRHSRRRRHRRGDRNRTRQSDRDDHHFAQLFHLKPHFSNLLSQHGCLAKFPADDFVPLARTGSARIAENGRQFFVHPLVGGSSVWRPFTRLS